MENVLITLLSFKPNPSKCLQKCYKSFNQKRTVATNYKFCDNSFGIDTIEIPTMRKDLTNTQRRSESKMFNRIDDLEEFKLQASDNPVYEDPRDVIVSRQPPSKPPRKNKDSKLLLKEQKRKLTKKYESLIVNLMDRCEESVTLLSEKDNHISKLKEKLKSVLEYNKLFADENDQLKDQYGALVKYVQDCKGVVQDLEMRNKELEERVKREVPDRDTSAIPLVEVCMSCNSRQVLLTQMRDHNNRLQKDMQALKDVLYRLNVQLSRYQEKLRDMSTTQTGAEFIHKPSTEAFDSLITASIGFGKHDINDPSCAESKSDRGTPTLAHSERVVDLSGLLSAQALAPLFDAYQENIQEKDNLIQDYEKQFETINKKSKQIVEDNKSLQKRVETLEEELARVNKSWKKIEVEKDTLVMENKTLIERVETAEMKLKEVYELYEDKISTMMRDYEVVHREYFATKNALAASESKMARMDATLRERTVPADLHERRVDDCKRLLEELKHHYSMERERKSDQLSKIQEKCKSLEEKYNEVIKENESTREELKAALRNVRLYRKAAVIFRQRLKSSNASITALRRSCKKRRNLPLRDAMNKLENIKLEIKEVKSRAYISLEQLEKQIREEKRRSDRVEEDYKKELERAQLVLDHKEGIIRSLIDKVADIEEVRLSQSNTHRLQGIVSDSSSDRRKNEKKEDKKEKLVPSHGGYYKETRDRDR